MNRIGRLYEGRAKDVLNNVYTNIAKREGMGCFEGRTDRDKDIRKEVVNC